MSDAVLQDIKDRLDIVETISSYLTVKRSGTNFKAPCPFHNEKTASLMISPAKQIWHCFGCGEGGDVFTFLMRYENIEFKEALKILADKAGIVLPEYTKGVATQTDDKDRLLRINNFAARFYHHVLLSSRLGQPALQYIQQRGLNNETLQTWQIGFAPNEFHALELALKTKAVSTTDLVKAGLSVKNEQGQIYDRFRDRITFPICNQHGEVVGFSARTLSSDTNIAKYINSPETVLYNKSKILFGLHVAKQAIRKADTVVVVEGQMDCIQAHQAGFTNTVASSGTALTSEHLHTLGRLTKNIIFSFDADSAGLLAARRAGEMALELGFKIKMAVVADAKDPDELIRKDPKLWQQLLQAAPWFIDFYIHHAAKSFPFNSVEQKRYISEHIAPLLKRLTDPIEQDHYIRLLANSFAIEEKALRETIVRSSVLASRPSVTSEHIPAQIAPEPLKELEKQILGGLIVVEQYRDFVRGAASLADFSNADVMAMIEELLVAETVASSILEQTLAKEAMFMVESELASLGGNSEALLKELQKSFYMLKLLSIKRQQQALSLEIKKAEQKQLKDTLPQLQQQFVTLSRLRMDYERKI